MRGVCLSTVVFGQAASPSEWAITVDQGSIQFSLSQFRNTCNKETKLFQFTSRNIMYSIQSIHMKKCKGNIAILPLSLPTYSCRVVEWKSNL